MKPEYPEGFLEQNLAKCREATICEGGCENHEYGVMPVRVIDRSGTPHDWGYYAYCPAAIEEDKSRGMDVITEGQADFLPNDRVGSPLDQKSGNVVPFLSHAEARGGGKVFGG